MSASSILVTIKVLHTLVWAIFAACVLAIPVFGLAQMYRYALWSTGIVLVEILILALNNWRCPLTAVAARYTEDRRDNFDIYLPAWLARNNKSIFGALFIVGQVIVILRWTGWIA